MEALRGVKEEEEVVVLEEEDDDDKDDDGGDDDDKENDDKYNDDDSEDDSFEIILPVGYLSYISQAPAKHTKNMTKNNKPKEKNIRIAMIRDVSSDCFILFFTSSSKLFANCLFNFFM